VRHGVVVRAKPRRECTLKNKNVTSPNLHSVHTIFEENVLEATATASAEPYEVLRYLHDLSADPLANGKRNTYPEQNRKKYRGFHTPCLMPDRLRKEPAISRSSRQKNNVPAFFQALAHLISNLACIAYSLALALSLTLTSAAASRTGAPKSVPPPFKIDVRPCMAELYLLSSSTCPPAGREQRGEGGREGGRGGGDWCLAERKGR